MIKEIRQYLSDIMDSLPGDGSQDKARQFIMELDDAAEMEKLLSENPAFKRMIDGLASDLRSRINKLVEADPELRALKNVLTKTLGQEMTKRRIQEEVESYVTQN